MDFTLCIFFFFFHSQQDCLCPVIPVDGSRELLKTCSKRFHDKGQLMVIYIYDTICPYLMITPAPVNEKTKSVIKYLYKIKGKDQNQKKGMIILPQHLISSNTHQIMRI